MNKMDNTSLSKEQKLRIEENKRRALAKRQQRSQGQTVTARQPTTQTADAASFFSERASYSNSNAAKPNTSQPLQTSRNSSHPITAKPQVTGSGTVSGINFSRPSTSTSVAVPQTGQRTDAALHQNQSSRAWFNKGNKPFENKGGGLGKSQFYGQAQQPLKGQCVLISKDRFEVNIGFSQTVVEVFKTISSRVYDAAKRKWNFNIQDHEVLLKAVSGLRPAVQVEPLPRAVLNVFGAKARSEGTDATFIPQADLSQVDSILVNSLMPFQREGVNFGVHLKGRVLIADDMGLGKTLQAISLACVYRSKWPVLVVTPSSVRFDWAQQFKRWVPSLDPECVHVAVTGRDNPASGLVNIISYDLLSRKAKQLTAARFHVIIMDESHFLKNHKTVRTKAALPLLQAAEHVVLLSGTPALSRPSELYTQIVAICPRMFKFHDFGLRYCDGKEHQWGWDYSGSSNMEELQLLLAERVMIRRLKQDVLSQLPAKRRQMVVLDPVSVASSRSLIQASKIMEKKLSGMARRGALLQYFHETSKVKISAVRDYVLDMVAAEKKFLIFAHHQEMLDSIEEAIAGENIQYIRIDGRTTSEQRHFFCRKFQMKDECKVAVLSITAANAGINLAAASIVVFAELFWNPGILVQAEDRVHRLGQQDSVLVYYLVAQKTADDYIWPLVQSKLKVLGQAGLAGEDFANTDTAHVRDPKQKQLLDMFEESFLDESGCEDLVGSDETATSTKPDEAEFPSKFLPSTPSKRKATDSPSKRQQKKLSPGKGQTGINQFFHVDTICSARSPQKASRHDGKPHTGTASLQAPVSSTRGEAGMQRSAGDHQQQLQQGDGVAYSACDVVSSEWDTEMEEGAFADLAAGVDWDDEFDSELESKNT